MTSEDRPAFAQLMALLGETFDSSVSALRVEGYFIALTDLDLKTVRFAVATAVRHHRFFPKPADLHGYATGQVEDAAEVAWAGLLVEIRRVGWVGTPALLPAIRATVDRIWGGWRECCETMPAGGPELLGWRKMFLAHYQAAQRSHDREWVLAAHDPMTLPEHDES